MYNVYIYFCDQVISIITWLNKEIFSHSKNINVRICIEFVVSLLSPIFADNNNKYTVRKSGTIVTQHKFDANTCVYVFKIRKYFFVQPIYDT